MAIEGQGYRVLAAGDGADALRIRRSQPCDAVVSDEAMPMMDGRALIAAMPADARLATITGRPRKLADMRGSVG